MFSRARFIFALATLLALASASDVARAQISSSSSGGVGTNTGTESVSSPIPNPNRALLQNGQYVDVTNTPRPQNLNPTGVNFSDCEQDLQLTFPLILAGFNGGSGIQAWAGTQDCTQDSNRGVGGPPLCWPISPPATALLYTSATSVNMVVYARDAMRYENTSFGASAAPSYDPTWHGSAAGESACHQQQSDAAISINIAFVPVNISTKTYTGSGYVYPGSSFITDTVAPPPPTVNGVGFGDTMLTVNWTSPGDDPDIAGFAVWMDPPAGGIGGSVAGCNCGSTPGAGAASSYVGDDGGASAPVTVDASQLVCIDAGSDGGLSSVVDGGDAGATDGAEDGPGTDAGGDGSTALSDAEADGGVPPGGDGQEAGPGADGGEAGDGAIPPGCHYVNVGGAGGACDSYALTGHYFVVGEGTTCPDGGDSGCISSTPTAPVTTTSDDGAITGGEGGVTLSGGGIAEIPPQYKAVEIDDRTATQSPPLTGLTNGDNYVVVVTSVDGSGNVGPPSPPQCATPVPVDDFWKTYKQDGGSAAGCALESAGLPAQMPVLGIATALLVTLLRRRKRP